MTIGYDVHLLQNSKWLEIQSVNQTFDDELDFDVSELDPIFDEPDEGAK